MNSKWCRISSINSSNAIVTGLVLEERYIIFYAIDYELYLLSMMNKTIIQRNMDFYKHVLCLKIYVLLSKLPLTSFFLGDRHQPKGRRGLVYPL